MATLQEALEATKGVVVVQKAHKNPTIQKGPVLVPKDRKKFSFASLTVPKIGIVVRSAEEIRAEQEDFRRFKEEITKVMPDYVGQMRQIEAMSANEQAYNTDAYSQLQDAVAVMLSYGDPDARAVSVLVYAVAMLKSCPLFRNLVEHTIDRLVSVGLLSQIQAVSWKPSFGEVKVYGRNFALTTEYRGSKEAVTVLSEIKNLLSRTTVAASKRFLDDLETLRSKVDVSLSCQEFKSGKPGRILVQIPDIKSTDGKVLRGGWVVFESADQKARLIDAAGSLQNYAYEMIRCGITVPIDQIGALRLEMSERLGQKDFGLTLSMWKWLNTMGTKPQKDVSGPKPAQTQPATPEMKMEQQVTTEMAIAMGVDPSTLNNQ